MQLNWNTGGWFGSQLGGTTWILVAAAIALGHDIRTGLILIGLFLFPNIVGYLLWQQKIFSCHASIQILFSLIGVFGLLAIYVLDQSHLWLAIQKGGSISVGLASLLLILIVLILMVTFYIRFGREEKASST